MSGSAKRVGKGAQRGLARRIAGRPGGLEQGVEHVQRRAGLAAEGFQAFHQHLLALQLDVLDRVAEVLAGAVVDPGPGRLDRPTNGA